MELRSGNRILKSMSDLQTRLQEGTALTSAQIRILNELLTLIDVKSTCFRVVTTARAGNRGAGSTLSCVYDRDNKRIIYWHET
jgi:hypothetical protein